MTEKPILAVLGGRRIDPPPVWLMRQAGRYLPEYIAVRKKARSFLDLCLDPVAAVEITLQPVHRFNLDAAILFADILLVPYALGQGLEYVDGEGPRLDALVSPKDMERLVSDKLLARLAPVGETVAAVAASLPSNVTLIGFAGAPWTVARYMISGGKDKTLALQWLQVDPDGYERLSDILVQATVEYLVMQVSAGAEVLKLFDSWAGDLPPEYLDRFCIAPMRRIVSELEKRCPGVPVIGFPRGISLSGYQAFASNAGATAIAIDDIINAQRVVDTLDSSLPLQGNLSPDLLEGDSPMLEQGVEDVCCVFRDRPHIFNLGHGIRPTARPDNVERLVQAVRSFRAS